MTLIDTTTYPINRLLPILLKDMSTERNIIWATNSYVSRGPGFSATDFITCENASIPQPRICKAKEEQKKRTKGKAEVFTPSWLCNKMNNYADEQWFGRKDVFNHENEDNTWTITDGPVQFCSEKSWQDYIGSTRLEITCGEAPYLVSRYDTTTGEVIPISQRIGMLDRKLRVVNENATTQSKWLEWAERAVQSCYGYEWQGDSLLIARINALMTFYEYFIDRWGKVPDIAVLERIAYIISWNIWQMDGLKRIVPYSDTQSKIFDWKANEAVLFADLR